MYFLCWSSVGMDFYSTGSSSVLWLVKGSQFSKGLYHGPSWQKDTARCNKHVQNLLICSSKCSLHIVQTPLKPQINQKFVLLSLLPNVLPCVTSVSSDWALVSHMSSLLVHAALLIPSNLLPLITPNTIHTFQTWESKNTGSVCRKEVRRSCVVC